MSPVPAQQQEQTGVRRGDHPFPIQVPAPEDVDTPKTEEEKQCTHSKHRQLPWSAPCPGCNTRNESQNLEGCEDCGDILCLNCMSHSL